MSTEDMERARITVERATEQQRTDEAQRTEGSARRAAVMRTMALQRHAGLGDHNPAAGVDFLDRIHPLHREDDLAGLWHGGANQPGHAALRRHGHLG